MERYLVCDGGGSKTDFIVFDRDGTVYGYVEKKGTNAIFFGEEDTMGTICSGITECTEKSGCGLNDLLKISLFIPGFKSSVGLVREKLNRPDIEVFGDEHNALYTAFGASLGIVAVSGTGSFAIGRDRAGREISCGGWGPLFGDKGSGYHVGLMCLERIADLYDSGVENNSLQTRCLSALNLESVRDLRHAAYRPDFTRDKVAALCKTAAEAAMQGDATAEDIFASASDELAKLVRRVSLRLESDGLPVAVTGGVSKAGPVFLKPFTQKLALYCPRCVYRPSRYTPIVGSALFLLHRQVGVPLEDSSIGERLMKYTNRR